MTCIHCNGEHPDGFKFCPVTGKEIVQSMKACTNPKCVDLGKYILPVDAMFCPRCGQKISCPKLSEMSQINGRKCKNTNNSKRVAHKNNNITNVLDAFFPIDGFYIGRTTLEDARKLWGKEDGDQHLIYLENIGSVRIYGKGSVYNSSNTVAFNNSQIPHKWRKLGFDMNLSVDDWKHLFERIGLKITLIKSYGLCAVTSDNSILIQVINTAGTLSISFMSGHLVDEYKTYL